MAHTFEYDEDYGNAAAPECWVRCPMDEEFYRSTRVALPWREPVDRPGDAMVVAIAWLESLIRLSRATPEEDFTRIGFLTRGLNVIQISLTLNHLIDEEGLLNGGDDDDDEVHEYKDFDELQRACDEVMEKSREDPNLMLDEESWDRFEPCAAAITETSWLDELTIADLLEPEGDLRVYTDLTKVVGPRAVEAERNKAGTQCRLVIGGANGGLLIQALSDYYVGEEADKAGVDKAFLAAQIPDFIQKTRWQWPYDCERAQFKWHAFDINSRKGWHKATRAEWPALVRSRIDSAVKQLHPLREVMGDHLHSTANLTREVGRVGDMVLEGDNSQKLPFARINEVNQYLHENFDGFIHEARDANRHSDDIIQRLAQLMAVSGAKNPLDRTETEAPSQGAMDPTTLPPKKAQLRKALAARSYARLESKYLGILQAQGQPDKEALQLLSDCFAEETVIPKAVLLGGKGVGLAAYTQASDFLDLLKDEARSMPLYLGQCMAYDDEEEEVPESLGTFALEAGQFELVRTFRWAEVDFLNYAALSIKAESMGAKFRSHDIRQAYHYADTIDLITEVAGKLFKGLGYPQEVPKGQGLTFTGFMKKVKRMQVATLGMTTSETWGMLKLIDGFVREGYDTAADNARVIIYGANPAGKALGAWIPESAPVVVKITSALSKLKKVDEMRVGLPDVFGAQPIARTLPSFATSSVTTTAHDEEGGATPSRRRRKRQRREKKPGAEVEVEPRPKLTRLGREERLRENPKRVFHYSDGKFSTGRFLFDWPAICKHFGWTSSDLCGPVTMTYAFDANREYACMSAKHR